MITGPESALISDQYPLADRERIYQILCQTLAGQSDRMSWPAFSLAEWDRLIATARAEGVAPLLYHALEGGEWKRGKEKRENGIGLQSA